jgi:hypothetical protein
MSSVAESMGGSEHMRTPETPAATHRLTHRSTESSLGHLPHSILAREVMRLKEAKDAVLRQGGGGTMEQAKALRVEIGQIEQQAQADTVALAQEVSLTENFCSATSAVPSTRRCFPLSSAAAAAGFSLRGCP